MNWTDKKLAECQNAEREAERVNAIVTTSGARNSDLYRLARLGLAAEAVGRGVFEERDTGEPGIFTPYRDFLYHPAWEERR